MAGFKRVFPLLGPLRSATGRAGQGAGQARVRRHEQRHDPLGQLVRQRHDLADGAGPQSHPALRGCRRAGSTTGRSGGSSASWTASSPARATGRWTRHPSRPGFVIAGFNPVAVDLACARLMGFDRERLPMLKQACREHPLPLCTFPVDDIMCYSNTPRFQGGLSHFEGPGFAFEPHFGWRNQISIGC